MNIMKLFKDKKVIIAGPCSFGSYKELDEIASALKEVGIDILRAGTFKGRTSPDTFQGLGEKGIEILNPNNDYVELVLANSTAKVYTDDVILYAYNNKDNGGVYVHSRN